MTTITYVRTADGRTVPQSEALDERGMLRDGHTMRSSGALMDGRSVLATDADQERRNALIDGYNDRIGDAWRSPPPDPAADAKVRDATVAKIGDPYERYDRRIQDAWR